MDLVYVIANDSLNEYPELVYSIRSMHAHQEFERIWLAGQPPERGLLFTDEVGRLFVPRGNDRYRNTSDNLLAAIRHPEVSDPFVYMNDDFFCLDSSAHTLWNRGSLNEALIVRRHGTRYRHGGVAALQMMEFLGCEDPMSFELHIPMVFNKELIEDVISMMREAKQPEAFKRTVYGNLIQEDTTTRPDVKRAEMPLPADDWVSSTGNGFRNGSVGHHIRALFPDPSPYELEYQ